jgi:peroxiredoxin
MPSLDWQVVAEIATTVSTVAFAASAIVVVVQLRQAARERYFSVTAHLFEIWQSPEFQRDQLFLLHKLPASSWEDFCALGRGEHPEQAIHRVGGYYDRVGNLVRHRLIQKDDILPTIGGYAVAVWHRIEPLVKELRLRENAVLFENYESLLPECRECYVPGIERGAEPDAMSTTNAANGDRAEICAISPALDREPVLANGASVAEAGLANTGPAKRRTTEMATENTSIDAGTPAAPDFSLPDTDGVVHNLSEFTALGPAVLVYVRGAYCPYCLRQLSDYAERYRDFKQSGIEVVAVSPESPRRSRRLRTGLKLPFTVLSDSKLEAAKNLGLIGHEKPGEPTPATLVLDGHRGVRLSTLNQREKCLFARDTLEYARALKQESVPHSIPAPRVETPKPGFLVAKALVNMAAGLVIR